jgi:hypothetical protein
LLPLVLILSNFGSAKIFSLFLFLLIYISK